MIAVRPAELADAGPMAAAMRAADVRELSAAGSDDPLAAVERAIAGSELAWSGWLDGRPVAVGGIGRQGSAVSPVGVPWLLGTDLVETHAFEAAIKTRRLFCEMRDRFPDQMNYVHAENVVSLNWLAWLGYDIHLPRAYGPKGESFHMFTLGVTYV